MMRRRTFLASSTAVLPYAALTAERGKRRRRNILASGWSPEKLAAVLLPPGRWKPYPAADDRGAWAGLPDAIRGGLVSAGEQAIETPWPALPATLFLDYVRTGNRSRYEAAWYKRRGRMRALVLAECAEGKGRFLDEIANSAWSICEESYWGFPAHLDAQKRGPGLPDLTDPVVELFSAEAAAELAWADYLLGPALDRIDPLIRDRIRLEIERRILAPYFLRDDWGWMGLIHDDPVNNWNPWINSNCLACALLMNRDERRRPRFVYKTVRSLDRFLDSYADDGGCDEGPQYWGGAGALLFASLELLHSASAGAIDFYSVPLIAEIGRYIYRVHIQGDWFVNFADASARIRLPVGLVFRYGRSIGDKRMQALAASFAREGWQLRSDSLFQTLPELFGPAPTVPAEAPLVRDAWLPDLQVMTARLEEGSARGFYLAAQGGHNAESHNHNDVGNFIVFADGQPLIIDVGVGTYTAKTFGPHRYEIWTMQSAYHNLPTVNGVMQAAGREFAARDVSYRSDDALAEFSLDIAGAYPAEGDLETWKRTLRLDRSRNRIEISERYRFRRSGARLTLTLMTACEVRLETGRILLADRAAISYPATLLKARVEEIKIDDARLGPVWGERLRRILLAAENLPATGGLGLEIVQL